MSMSAYAMRQLMRSPGEPLGYTWDAATYHPDCLPNGVDPNGEGVGILPAWEDCDHNLECDACCEIVVEANVEDEDDYETCQSHVQFPICEDEEDEQW